MNLPQDFMFCGPTLVAFTTAVKFKQLEQILEDFSESLTSISKEMDLPRALNFSIHQYNKDNYPAFLATLHHLHPKQKQWAMTETGIFIVNLDRRLPFLWCVENDIKRLEDKGFKRFLDMYLSENYT
eukprot:UN27846